MRAWRVHEFGAPPECLSLETCEPPVPRAGQVGIDVHAASLNFPDLLMCQGLYQVRPDLPFTPGVEVAGVVRAVGDDVDSALIGQSVCAIPLIGPGGFAEHTIASTRTTFAVDAAMDWGHAASFAMTYQTAWFALHRRAQLRRGETVLVHAGAGGVGSAAIQLAKAHDAFVIASAGGSHKVEVCRQLGADLAIDYTTEDFVTAVKDATDGRGADVIVDPVGGEVFDRSRKCIAFEGRIVVVGFTSGRIPEVPTNHVLVKNYSVVGLHWGLYDRYAPELFAAAHQNLLRQYGDGRIAPLVTEELPFTALPEAMVRLGQRDTVGKIVLRTS
ncbi:MAG: NADPH:quinone oxidoreductase family protein [Acidimicrobiia bacterium]